MHTQARVRAHMYTHTQTRIHARSRAHVREYNGVLYLYTNDFQHSKEKLASILDM